MKKFLEKKISVKSLLVLVVVILIMTVAIAAMSTRVWATLSPNISIELNGAHVTPVDGLGNITYPLVYNNTTYLPVRAVSTILDVDIGWNQQTQTVSLNTIGGVVQPPVTQPNTIPAAGGSVNVNGMTSFSFTPNQSGAWQFRTSNNNGCDPYLWLYDAQETLMTENDNGAGERDALIIYYLDAGTTYKINASFASGAGQYTLTASLAPTIPAAGGLVSVSTPTLYAFTPNRTGLWSFNTSNDGRAIPHISIFDTDDHYLGEVYDNSENHNAVIAIPMIAGQTYVIGANLLWDSPAGSFTIMVAPQAPAVMPSGGGTFGVNGETCYSFIPEASGTWLFQTSDASADANPYLILYDADFNQLASDDDSAGYPHARLSYYLYAGTTYHIYARFFVVSSGNCMLSVSRT